MVKYFRSYNGRNKKKSNVKYSISFQSNIIFVSWLLHILKKILVWEAFRYVETHNTRYLDTQQIIKDGFECFWTTKQNADLQMFIDFKELLSLHSFSAWFLNCWVMIYQMADCSFSCPFLSLMNPIIDWDIFIKK